MILVIIIIHCLRRIKILKIDKHEYVVIMRYTFFYTDIVRITHRHFAQLQYYIVIGINLNSKTKINHTFTFRKRFWTEVGLPLYIAGMFVYIFVYVSVKQFYE